MSEEKAIYDTRQSRSVLPEERRLLDYFRDELKWGEAVIIIKDGLPVMVQAERKHIKLTD